MPSRAPLAARSRGAARRRCRTPSRSSPPEGERRRRTSTASPRARAQLVVVLRLDRGTAPPRLTVSRSPSLCARTTVMNDPKGRTTLAHNVGRCTRSISLWVFHAVRSPPHRAQARRARRARLAPPIPESTARFADLVVPPGHTSSSSAHAPAPTCRCSSLTSTTRSCTCAARDDEALAAIDVTVAFHTGTSPAIAPPVPASTPASSL